MLWYVWLFMITLGILLLLVSLILMFVLKVPELLDELSGRKAKRQIKRLKELNIGTGNLEGMVTEDFYLSIPAEVLESSEKELEPKVSKKVPEVKKEVVNNVVSDANDVMDEEEINTDFMDEEEVPTSFMEEENETGIISDVKDFINNRKVIEIIEEQTSL